MPARRQRLSGTLSLVALAVLVGSSLVLTMPAGGGPVSGRVHAPAGASATVLGFRPAGFTRCPPGCNTSFNGSGLPSNASFDVAVSGENNGSPMASTDDSLTFYHMDNGTYTYVVLGPVGYEVTNAVITNASHLAGPALSGHPGPEKVAGGGESVGRFTVAGGNVYIALTFARGPTRSLTVSESGLAGATRWCVGLASAAVLCTTGGSVRIDGLTPGTYGLTVPGVPGYAELIPPPASVDLNSSSASVHVRFAPVLYTLTFSASGLAVNTAWKVTLFWASGTPAVNHVRVRSTRGTTIVFDVTNGTYNYSLSTVAGYGLPTTPPIIINGTGVVRHVDFVPVPSAVTFLEAGLPSGSIWSITIGNATLTTNSTMLTFSLPNGKYTYVVGAPVGYVGGHHGSGTITVKGASVTVRVRFHRA